MTAIAEHNASQYARRWVDICVNGGTIEYSYSRGDEWNELIIITRDRLLELIDVIISGKERYRENFILVISIGNSIYQSGIEFLSRLLCGIPSEYVNVFDSGISDNIIIRCRNPSHFGQFRLKHVKFVCG